MITLKPNNFKGTDCTFSDNWVSNGHWAIKKGHISNAAMFVNAETIAAFTGKPPHSIRPLEDSKIESLIPKALEPYTVTRLLTDNQNKGVYTRILQSDCLYVGLATNYLDLIGKGSKGDVLYGDKSCISPLCNANIKEEVTMMIMPVKLKGLEESLIPLQPENKEVAA